MWKWIRVRKRVKKKPRVPAKHYREHKETARILVHARLFELNKPYGFIYNKVAIRDQRSRWGSCSIRKNLNFNYRILFLPAHLVDYIIVHELCHLEQFNHSHAFWNLVGTTVPDYDVYRKELQKISMQTLGKK